MKHHPECASNEANNPGGIVKPCNCDARRHPVAEKTRKVEMWVDLWPGWQDSKDICLFAHSMPMTEKPFSNRRIKITVDLPCFGGSAECDDAVHGLAEIEL